MLAVCSASLRVLGSVFGGRAGRLLVSRAKDVDQRVHQLGICGIDRFAGFAGFTGLRGDEVLERPNGLLAVSGSTSLIEKLNAPGSSC